MNPIPVVVMVLVWGPFFWSFRQLPWFCLQMMRAFRNQGGVQQAKSEAKGAVGRAAISQAGRV